MQEGIGINIVAWAWHPRGTYPARETMDRLEELSATPPQGVESLRLLRVEQEAGLQDLQQASGDVCIFLDARARLAPDWLESILERLRRHQDAICFSCGEDIPHLPQGLNHGCYRLLEQGTQVRIAFWSARVQDSLSEVQGVSPYHLLLSLLLALAPGHSLRMVSSVGLLLPGSSSFRPKDLQAAHDAGNLMLEQAMRRFLTQEWALFPAENLASEYALATRQVLAMFKDIQEGKPCSPRELAVTGFVFVLLAMKHGQVQSARDVMSTLFSMLREQAGLMRLYKLLTTMHPIPDRRRPVLRRSRRVSVIIALFNQGHYLEEAVRSVLAQTHAEWELVVINDGSTDDSLERAQELVDSLKDSRIRLLDQTNRGKGATRNRGIRETDGQVLVSLDSDDLIAPDYFSIGLEMLERHPRAGWISPKTLVFGKDNHLAWFEPYDFAVAMQRCPSPCSAMIRRQAMERAGLYREDMSNREDAELWYTLAENGWVGMTTPEPLFLYRHACKRPGLREISNVASKEELCSLHPWWFRMDLSREMRHRAYMAFPTGYFPDWFMNAENLMRMSRVWHDRDAFLACMQEIRKEHPPITGPRRWDESLKNPHLKVREALYGVRSDQE